MHVSAIMMAYFVRVIPNRLYNKLQEDGMLDDEAHFPQTEKNPVDTLVSSLPDGIQTQARQILTELVQLKSPFTWDEKGQFSYNSKWIVGSNLSQILSGFVLEERGVKLLEGWENFREALSDANIDLGTLSDTNLEDKAIDIAVEELEVEKEPEIVYAPLVGGKSSQIKNQCRWIRFEDKFDLK
jgi:hypothetical protein